MKASLAKVFRVLKEKRRRELAALPIERKLAIAFGFEEMLRPIRRWKAARAGLKETMFITPLKADCLTL